MTAASTSVQWLAHLPWNLWESGIVTLTKHQELISELSELKIKNLLLQQEVQKLTAITSQNTQLQNLLNATKPMKEEVLIAEIIGINPNPFTHTVTINKGSKHGVYQGQAVLDDHGIIGQVTSVTIISSLVMLITDSRLHIPVVNNRSHYRTIAFGSNNPQYLQLLHVPTTADFQPNDLIITSGLDNFYPYGYPIGIVHSVNNTAGSSFSSIFIKPLAQTQKSRLVILVFKDSQLTTATSQSPQIQKVSSK